MNNRNKGDNIHNINPRLWHPLVVGKVKGSHLRPTPTLKTLKMAPTAAMSGARLLKLGVGENTLDSNRCNSLSCTVRTSRQRMVHAIIIT